MRRLVRRFRRVALTLFVVSLLLAVGIWLYMDFALRRVPAFTDYDGRVAGTAGTNWLLVGSDSRAGLSGGEEQELSTGAEGDAAGERTDTMMLLHVPSGADRPTLVSLPRDTLVPIDGHGSDKLNASYTFGGPALLSRTVEQVTGLRIDHYVEIGLGGFAGVTDAVGGVRMCLATPIQDPTINLDLAAGCQTLGGAQALGFVRTRHAFARGDLERVENQRQLLAALIDRSTSAGVLANPLRAVPMVVRGAGAVTVADGDHLHDLARLAYAMRGAGSGGLVTTTAPVGGSVDVPGLGSALLWDRSRAAELFTALRQDRPVPADVIGHP